MEPHRSIQDIIPPARSRPIRTPSPTTLSSTPPPPPPPTPPQPLDMHPDRPRGMASFALIGGIVLVVAAIIVGIVSFVFHRAYITVTPATFPVTVQANSIESSIDSPMLPYQKVTATDTLTKSVPATGTQHVENHSSGTITLYNAYSATSQRLITNTRFASKSGLVFRVHAPVVIPGYTTKAGLKVPGSVDVTVYADEAGDKYNIGADDFTVPGLKGSKQYDLIYAKSKAQMTGGFVGEQAVVDQTIRAQTITELKGNLERSIRAKILATTPAGSLVFNDTIAIVYTEGTDTADGSNAIITVSASAIAPAFSEASFAQTLSNPASGYTGPLRIENPSNLSVHVNTPDAVGSEAPITISVSGQTNLVATFDTEQLRKDLAGKNKTDVKTVLPAYPGISDFVVKVYPFWLSTIPKNPKDIKIELVAPLDQNQ